MELTDYPPFIFYNLSIFLNLIKSDKLSEELIKSVSPVAWQHINFFGRYEFTKNLTPLNLDELTDSVKEIESLVQKQEISSKYSDIIKFDYDAIGKL